jgi:hypothetical protein
MRLSWLAGLLTLAGCCLVPASDIEDLSSSTAGASPTSGTTTSLSQGTSGTGTGLAQGSGGTTLGGSTGGISQGATTGSFVAPTPGLKFLLDAGQGEVFGPIAIAPSSGASAVDGVKLAYSAGDGGQFQVSVQSFSSDCHPSGPPIEVSTTNRGLSEPPNLTVSDDGERVAICWEDYASIPNPSDSPCSDGGPVVLCASLLGAIAELTPTFSSCGDRPSLVFNPTDDSTQLFIRVDSQGGAEWDYGSGLGESIGLWATDSFVAFPVSQETDAMLFSGVATPFTTGLWLSSNSFSPQCGYDCDGGRIADIDPSFDGGEFAASPLLASHSVGIAELGRFGLRGIVWQIDSERGMTSSIPTSEPVVGPVATGTCSTGFGYLVASDGGSVLLAEQAFDGTPLPTVKAIALATNGFTSELTSMATTSGIDGGLFVALSGPAQIALYFIDCQ